MHDKSGSAMSANPMVGGAAMYANKDIVDNAVNSKDHTTLVAAVKAAGLVDTLKSPGPFTVFAPTNAAFAALPAGTVDTLLKPENKPTLTKVLTYHVVPGKVDAQALMAMIAAGGGKATLKTASGGTLTATMGGGNVMHHRRQGRHRHGDDRQRLPVQRRDPRGRQGAAAGLRRLQSRWPSSRFIDRRRPARRQLDRRASASTRSQRSKSCASALRTRPSRSLDEVAPARRHALAEGRDQAAALNQFPAAAASGR